MKRNYHNYGTRNPMQRALRLAGVSDRTRAQVTLNIVQQAELLQDARDIDLAIQTVRTEATHMSDELDKAKKYIERLKGKLAEATPTVGKGRNRV